VWISNVARCGWATSRTKGAHYGKPLDGVRILAAEQMQALPYATQLLGASVPTS